MTTLIRRHDWELPHQRVTGPARKADTTATVIHWEGAGRTGHVEDGVTWCRTAQNAYLNSRGFSLGYNYAVISGGPQDGYIYEIRASDINNAANKGDGRTGWPYNANDYTRSIIGLGIQGHQLTGAAIQSMHQLVIGTVAGHRDVDATQCCGDPYYAQLGLIAQPPQEEEDMPSFVWRHRSIPGAFWVANGSVVHLDATMRDQLLAKGAIEVVSDNTEVSQSYQRVAQGLTQARVNTG